MHVMNSALEIDLAVALRAIDERIYASVRDQLRVNQPDHAPSPRVFVPSRSRITP